MRVKDEIRIIAWDDCGFTSTTKHVRVIGLITRGAKQIDGMLSIIIKKDGNDATKKMADAILSSRHYNQLSVIMLDGISFAGFNIVDIDLLHKLTRIPVIAVQRKKPDVSLFLQTLKKLFPNRVEIAKKAGIVKTYKNLCYQCKGIDIKICEKIFDLTCIHSNLPEPLRIAHIIATGLSGESKGRA